VCFRGKTGYLWAVERKNTGNSAAKRRAMAISMAKKPWQDETHGDLKIGLDV
jgi:hypothetical protein